MKHHSECSMYRQVIARRDDMTPPIAADLRPCTDGSSVRTALVACRAGAAYSLWRSWSVRLGQLEQTDRRTDGSRYSLTPPRGWAPTCSNIVAVMTSGFGLGLGLAGQVLAMALADVVKLRYINSNI